MKKEKPVFYLLLAFSQAFVDLGQVAVLHNANYQWKQNKDSFVVLLLSVFLLVLSLYHYFFTKKASNLLPIDVCYFFNFISF